MPPHVSVESRPDGIAVLSFHNPPINAVSTETLRLLSTHLRALNADPSTRAVVLHGASAPGFFSCGADLHEISDLATSPTPFTADVVWCLTPAEAARLPVVAAIDGTCLGGGLELALCCAARVCTPASTFTLPETKVGLIPGLGATQRLPRAVGLEPALHAMLTGEVLDATRAARLGLVDRVVSADPPAVIDAAVAHAAALLASGAPKPRLLGSTVKLPPVDECERIVDGLRATLVTRCARGGALPQFDALLDVVLHGVRHGATAGLAEETRVFESLVAAPHSQALVHVFFATQAVGAAITPAISDAPPAPALRRVAVVGGGHMGAGIAAALVAAGLSVCVKEVSWERAEAARARVRDSLRENEREKAQGLLSVTADYADIADADLVIEAAFEDAAVKKDIFRALERVCKPTCVLATNTSTIGIDVIGSGASKALEQGRLIGAHFFSPVHKMPLLEVVRSDKTSTASVRTVFDLAKVIGKTAVLVANGPGSAVNRMYSPFGMMAGFLTSALGLDPYRVDAACEAFGLPMGPFRLADLVGLEVWVAVAGSFRDSFPDRSLPKDPVIAALVVQGRHGRKSGQGFYRYGDGASAGSPDREVMEACLKQARDALAPGQAEDVQAAFDVVSDEDIVHMLLLPCASEGYRIVTERVVQNTDNLDICSIMGMGFPSHLGGLMYWAERRFGGAAGVWAALESLHKRCAYRCPLVRPTL